MTNLMAANDEFRRYPGFWKISANAYVSVSMRFWNSTTLTPPSGHRNLRDSIKPLLCSHCNQPMNLHGDHATICKHGFSVVHCHNTLRYTFAQQVFRGAGLSYTIEAPGLIPHTSCRPLDILAQPVPPSTGEALGRPTAYDITVWSHTFKENSPSSP